MKSILCGDKLAFNCATRAVRSLHGSPRCLFVVFKIVVRMLCILEVFSNILGLRIDFPPSC
jgi:hypothetical protein